LQQRKNPWHTFDIHTLYYNISKEYIIAKVIYVGISKQFTLANSNEIRPIPQTVRIRFITVEVWIQSGIFSGQNNTGTNILLFFPKYKAAYLYINQD